MKNIKDLVERSTLAEIAQRSLLINDLNRQLQQVFPSVFQGRFRIAMIRNEIIYCEVESATLRQGILFRQAELLALAQRVFPQAKKLEFKVNPDWNLG